VKNEKELIFFLGNLLSGFFDILQIILNQRRHFRRLPVCLFGSLRPGKREVKDLPWSFSLLQYGKGF
jgi:hypothetical protein